MLVFKGCLVKILSHLIGGVNFNECALSVMIDNIFNFLLHNLGLKNRVYYSEMILIPTYHELP